MTDAGSGAGSASSADLESAERTRPRQLTWVRQQLSPGEEVLGWSALHGGITAEMSRLVVGAPDGARRSIVLRTYVGRSYDRRAGQLLHGEAAVLAYLAEEGVPTPRLIAVDPDGAHCEYPSLLMSFLPGRTVLGQHGIGARIPQLAQQLVTIHGLRPAQPPPVYRALTTPDSVIVPPRADHAAWAAAIDIVRRPAPPYHGRFLHRDFQPGNVLFGPSSAGTAPLTGVVDWQVASWGPADLDVAHCCTNLALLHGPEWSLRFAEAYERAGGSLAATTDERRYWFVRDVMAASEEVQEISVPWREAGRIDLTPHAVQARLDAYLVRLMDVMR